MVSKYMLLAICVLLHFSSAFCSALSDSLSQKSDSTKEPIEDDRIYRSSIRTVLLHPTGQPMKAPLLFLNTNGTLQLSFDELDSDNKTYHYTLIHCDANWQPSDLLPQDYLDGFTEDEIKDVRSSFNTTVPYVHYCVVFPNEQMKIGLSGNYLVKVYERDSSDKPVLTSRMMVVDEKVKITGNVHQATTIEDRKYKQEVDFSISHDHYPIENPFTDLKVCIRQNRRKDNAICDLKPLYVKDHVLDYNYNGENAFDGGSEFRRFDARSSRKAGERIVKKRQDLEGIHLQVEKDLKRSYLRYSFDNDMNGGFSIKTYDGKNDSLEAEYVWVHLTLNSEESYSEGSVYAMGDFCAWHFDPENKMVYDPEGKSYHANLYLKQGYYNYCYLLKSENLAKGETSVVEGDHYETENDYLICVYYRAAGSLYDSLISASVLNSLVKN